MHKTVSFNCQIHSLPEIAGRATPADMVQYVLRRLKRCAKRRFRYLTSFFSEITGAREREQSGDRVSRSMTLTDGDLVRVKSPDRIRGTLDRWNRLQGCAFMEEMLPYCDTTRKVMKRVEKFLDERDYRIKRCRGIVLLEGVICRGTKDYGDCDRCCYFFWREEWLEKIWGAGE